ncbi:membrane-associated transporter protein [Elysia marginata]|uniref:Membrane-associated transporter protein n=1 Tax=Elysia marginata TaxID=1093978 RepID=A0AAV4FZL2_9GAST|nr:membrane-associated transporter protein [Elysia marginata]
MVKQDQSMAQQQKQRQIKHRNQHMEQQPKQMDSVAGVGIVGLVLLVVAMCGVEACMAFDHVYLFLMLQYLGTPVSLMSSCGVLTGLISLMTMPGLTYYANRGINSWKRKWYSIWIGLAVFLIGLILLAAASVIKIMDVSEALDSMSHMVNSSANSCLSGSKVSGNYTHTMSFQYTHVPITAVLGIVGFGTMDVAYDLSSPVLKSFVLDTLPTHQHSAVLATSTVLQGLGGTIISLIGVLNLPTMMESIFMVDGLAGTLLLLCGILIFLLLISFSTTLLSGYVIGGWMGKRKDAARESKNKNTVKFEKSFCQSEGHGQFKYKLLSTSSSESESTAADISIIEENGNSTIATEMPAQIYKRLDSINKEKQPNFAHSDEQQYLLLDSRYRTDSKSPKHCIYGGTERSEVHAPTGKMTQTFTVANPSGQRIHGNTTTMAPCHQSTKPRMLYIRNKRVIITCISCFFANGCLLCFSLYSPNALTIDIYKGDPLALPGLPGREGYEKGMRHSALGIMLMYISNLIFSACNHKIMKTFEQPNTNTQFGQNTIKFELNMLQIQRQWFCCPVRRRVSSDDSLTIVKSSDGNLDAPGA